MMLRHTFHINIEGQDVYESVKMFLISFVLFSGYMVFI